MKRKDEKGLADAVKFLFRPGGKPTANDPPAPSKADLAQPMKLEKVPGGGYQLRPADTE